MTKLIERLLKWIFVPVTGSLAEAKYRGVIRIIWSSGFSFIFFFVSNILDIVETPNGLLLFCVSVALPFLISILGIFFFKDFKVENYAFLAGWMFRLVAVHFLLLCFCAVVVSAGLDDYYEMKSKRLTRTI